MAKAGAAKKGWCSTRWADMRAKLHNTRTGLRRHDLTTTDFDRQTQSNTTATGLEMHPDHRHRASEVSRASKTNSRAAESVCHSMFTQLVVILRNVYVTLFYARCKQVHCSQVSTTCTRRVALCHFISSNLLFRAIHINATLRLASSL